MGVACKSLAPSKHAGFDKLVRVLPLVRHTTQQCRNLLPSTRCHFQYSIVSSVLYECLRLTLPFRTSCSKLRLTQGPFAVRIGANLLVGQPINLLDYKVKE